MSEKGSLGRPIRPDESKLNPGVLARERIERRLNVARHVDRPVTGLAHRIQLDLP
jgi:hypothetical protein